MSCIDLDTLIIPSFCDVHSLGLTSDQRVTGHLGFTGRGPDCVLFFVFFNEKEQERERINLLWLFLCHESTFFPYCAIAQKGRGSNISKHS